MCEFVVYLEEKDGTQREVTRNIVVAKRKGRITILLDVMGAATTLENASILEVNTLSQKMILALE